ncbi:MAG: cobaltochelatase CobT-related protein [Candidatus Helarchaeota archaeon]
MKKTIAICSQNPRIELQFCKNGYYTDGETIFLSPPPTEVKQVKRWILLESCAIHEAWHVLFQSDFDLLKEFIEKYEKKYKARIPDIGNIAKDIVNIIEDGRIENLGKKRFQGNKNTIDYSNSYWLTKRPSFKNMSDWRIFLEAILEVSITGGIKERIPDGDLKRLIQAASFYIYWAKERLDPTATFKAADKIMTLLLDFFDLEEPYCAETKLHPSLKSKDSDSSTEESSGTATPPPLPSELEQELDTIKKKREKTGKKSSKSTTKNSKHASETDNKSGKMNDVDDKLKGLNGNPDVTDNLKTKKDKPEDFGGTSHESENDDDFDRGSGDTDEKKSPEIKKSPSKTKSKSKSKANRKENHSKNGPESTSKHGTNHETSHDDIPIISSMDLDPFKQNLLDEASLRIKIEDISKRNIRLINEKEIEHKLNAFIADLKRKKIFSRVFKTETQDVGVEIPIIAGPKSQHVFNGIKKSIQKIIQVTINQFKSLFKFGMKSSSQLKSGRLDVKQVVRGIVRQDPHVFKKKVLENSRDEIAISLLIDQSGSMSGSKIKNARKAAILFSEVLSALSISFSVYGWTDIEFLQNHRLKSIFGTRLNALHRKNVPQGINREFFTIFRYKDFKEEYSETAFRLAEIKAFADNSDHNAINFAAEQLLKTKKRLKILFVISDGQPAALVYEYKAEEICRSQSIWVEPGNVGLNLTRQAVEAARSKGIQVICLSIDECQNYQEEIYGKNNYIILPPRRISELPNKMANILRLLLRQAGFKL